MKFIVFELHLKQNIWRCKDIEIQEIENYAWTLTIDNERHICDSIYDVLSELEIRGFHATFRIPKEMEDFNPMDKCY